jgi:hypothetical protein
MNEDFAKQKLDAHRENMHAAPIFECACCQKVKVRKEAAGVRIWRPQSAMLQNVSKDKVATYAICLECAELPENEIHQKVTPFLVSQGLFG